MKSLLIFLFICVIAPRYSFSYPDVIVYNRVAGMRAQGRVTYPGCRPGIFDIGFNEYFTERRGGCLITSIVAHLYNNTVNIEADEYSSSGTSYSLFDIRKEGERYIIKRL